MQLIKVLEANNASELEAEYSKWQSYKTVNRKQVEIMCIAQSEMYVEKGPIKERQLTLTIVFKEKSY